MFRKLEITRERSRKPDLRMADSCECGCTEYGQRGQKTQPVENKTTSKLGLHFIIKG